MVQLIMKRIRLTTLVLSIFLAQAALAARDYWVWIDDNGVTNYSEQKPKDRPAKHVTDGYKADPENWRRPGGSPPESFPDAEPAAVIPTRPANNKPNDKLNPDKLAADERKKMEQQIAGTKRQNCERARKSLQVLQNRPRIRVEGKDGAQRVLSEKEVQQKIKSVQELIKTNC